MQTAKASRKQSSLSGKESAQGCILSACLAAQTKRWAEGIRVPAPLAGRGSTTARGILRLCPAHCIASHDIINRNGVVTYFHDDPTILRQENVQTLQQVLKDPRISKSCLCKTRQTYPPVLVGLITPRCRNNSSSTHHMNLRRLSTHQL